MQVYHSGHPALLRYPFLIPPHPGLLINFVLGYFWFSLHSLTRCRQVSWSSLRSLRKGSLLIAMALSSFKVRTCRSHLLKWGGKHTCFMTSLSYYYWVRFHTSLSGASCSLRLDCAILFVVNNTICKQNSLRQRNRLQHTAALLFAVQEEGSSAWQSRDGLCREQEARGRGCRVQVAQRGAEFGPGTVTWGWNSREAFWGS